MALTLAKIEEIAPDQASLGAARKLLDARNWPTVAGDRQGLVWGECQGSGALPYRVALSEHDLAYKCSCPSRKLPCKHALALMWMRAEGCPVDTQERPDWVNAWLARRRKPGAREILKDSSYFAFCFFREANGSSYGISAACQGRLPS